MLRCHECQSTMTPTRLECDACGIALEGRFGTPRLARLESEDQQLIESFVLAGGNLKLLAEDLSLSYPTVRKRIDGLMARLQKIRTADEQKNEQWLKDIEAGNMSPEEAARLMRETAHG